MSELFKKSNIDLNKIYSEAKEKVYEKKGGYRLNFGVYYTPKFLWEA